MQQFIAHDWRCLKFSCERKERRARVYCDEQLEDQMSVLSGLPLSESATCGPPKLVVANEAQCLPLRRNPAYGDSGNVRTGPRGLSDGAVVGARSVADIEVGSGV